MFSKPKDNSAPQTQTQVASSRRSMRTAPSIISGDLTVQGSLVASGDVQIDGIVEGDVRSHALTIGDGATIDGDIYAEDVTIRGRVNGTIRARRVQLAESCHVEGDIIHESLAVETGAYFDGMCRHSDNPLGEASAPQTTPSPIKPAAPANESNRATVTPKKPESLFGQKPAAETKPANKDDDAPMRQPAAQ